MATVTAGRSSPIRFDLLDITGWLTGTVSGGSAAAMTVTSPAGGYRRFAGSGFTFGADGLFSGGTINSIALSAAGGEPWSISGLTMPVATLKSYIAGGNTAGFLAATLAGNDTLSGHATLSFHDYLDGYAGQDKLYGGGGNDTLLGGTGNDTLDGETGADRMDGGSGDDTYYVDSDTDMIVEMAGAGIDTILIADAYTAPVNVENLTLLAGAGAAIGNDLSNRIVGNDFSNDLEGLDGNDTILGGWGDDQIIGDDGNDSLDGGKGDDTLYGFDGKDTMVGGAGNDTFDVDNIEDLVIEAAGDGIDQIISRISITAPLAANVEDLQLAFDVGDTPIDGMGNALNNHIGGTFGNNVLNGLAGADTMIGYHGDDTYVVDNVGDAVEEILADAFATGYDTVQSSITFSLVEDGLRVKGKVEELVLIGTAAINGTGNGLANHITGNGAANTLMGLEGSDWLNGGGGTDKLIGGTGNDTYRIDGTGDVVIEDGGDKYDAVESTISVDLNVLGAGQIEDAYLLGTGAINAVGNGAGNLMMGNSAANRFTGGGGSDSLFGGGGNDSLDGGADADKLLGGDGNDTYFVGAGDTVNETGGSGIDTVIASVNFSLPAAGGEVENLTLQTGAGNIYGFGNKLANVIVGNEGDNVIIGGQGDDDIDGKTGNDTFVYSSVLDGHDLIRGFDADPTGGQDTLNLDWLFDSLGVATADRLARVQVTDRGLAVDIKVDVDGDGTTFELFAVTVSTASTLVKGEDVVVGTL